MTIGGSIFLVAVGAILRYAVTDSISGVGLVISLFMFASARRDAYGRDRVVERDRYVDREPLA